MEDDLSSKAVSTEFDAWAGYYDLIHEGLPGEAEFYVGQAVRIGGNTLELGCGTGRIAIPMTMSGVDVTGIDNSSGMLAVCREKAEAVGPSEGSLSLLRNDMAEFSLDERFNFICMPYRTFMHLERPARQLSCLRCIRDHLKDDGVAIFNTWMPNSKVIGKPQAERFVDEYPLDSGATLRHYHRAEFDEFNQRMVEEHRLVEVDGSGRHVDSVTLPLIRVWTWPRELKHLIDRAGLAVEALFGDFDCTPFGGESTEMIWVLRKNG